MYCFPVSVVVLADLKVQISGEELNSAAREDKRHRWHAKQGHFSCNAMHVTRDRVVQISISVMLKRDFGGNTSI